MREANISIRRRATLTNVLLPAAYSTAIHILQQRLRRAESCTVSFDGAKSSLAGGDKFVTIGYHIVDMEFNLGRYSLDLVQVLSSQTGPYHVLLSGIDKLTPSGPLLASVIRKKIEYHVGAKTLLMASVTDGGANYHNASQRLTGDSVLCSAHTAHLVVQDYFSRDMAAKDVSQVKVTPFYPFTNPCNSQGSCQRFYLIK